MENKSYYEIVDKHILKEIKYKKEDECTQDKL